jgi:hypothetical protein
VTATNTRTVGKNNPAIKEGEDNKGNEPTQVRRHVDLLVEIVRYGNSIIRASVHKHSNLLQHQVVSCRPQASRPKPGGRRSGERETRPKERRPVFII